MVMTDEEKISPEEKLLRIVEEGSRAKAQAEAGPSLAPAGLTKDAAGDRPPWSRFFASFVRGLRQFADSLGLKARAGRLREIFELKFHEMKERKLLPSLPSSFSVSDWRIDLRLINHLLVAAAILVFLFILLDFFLFNPRLAFEMRTAGPMALPEVTFGKGAPKALEEFTAQADKRYLFRPAAEQPAPQSEEKKTVEAEPALTSTDLKVVAVVSVEDGFEAIVEDVNKNQSYFLKKGDRFEGYEVESIDWKKVTLTRDGQRWELS